MRADLSHIKKRILSLHELGAIDFYLTKQDDWVISAVHLRRKDKKLLKESESPKVGEISALPSAIPVRIPIVVTINGKGVLLRKSEVHLTNPVAHFLPGSNPDEFYWDMYEAGGVWYVFIARKSLVEKVSIQLKELGYKLIGVHIGAGGIRNVLPFMKDRSALIKTFHYNISIDKGQVIGIEAVDHSSEVIFEESLLGNLYFKDFYLLSLGAALEGFVKEIPAITEGLAMPLVRHARKEVEWHRYYTLASWFALLSLLVMLLVNYALFSHYFSRNRELGASQALVRQSSEEEAALRGKVDSGYAYLDSLGWLKHSRNSYYMDRAAALILGSIVLNGMSTNPLQEGNNSEDFVFQAGMMRISGTCDDPDDLNTFIGSLRNLEMVQKVTLRTYQYKKDLGTSQFTVEVMTR